MDAESPVVVAGPSRVFCGRRRSRKVGRADIFRGVSVRELQRLFRSSGDEEAEQRAQVVWERDGGAELAQALMGLRARGRRNRSAAHTLGPRWLRAFTHLRISECSTSQDDTEDGYPEPNTPSNAADTNTHTPTRTHAAAAAAAVTHTPPQTHTSGARGGDGESSEDEAQHTHTPPHTSSPLHTHILSPLSLSSRVGLHRGVHSNPERYLHRIIH
ncbi:uncharacterized protein LOC134441234 [Engraulis encrasicolus]|uniref:uncharacterized protein LOC134441234 n=1 Tax=Engraulis encrasicolus TaxID=184585 RepID=UPI002FD336CA